MAIIEIRHQFDAELWQVGHVPPGTGSTILVTWTVTPPAAEAGIPGPVAAPFAIALCSIGAVLYGGDAADRQHAELVDTVPLRRGLRRHDLALFRAVSAEQVLPAFSSGEHNWSMNAQWLIVAGREQQPASEEMRQVVKQLYERGELPGAWPGGVLMIVQAAVDGDGAACHSAGNAVEQGFIQALRRAAAETGVETVIGERAGNSDAGAGSL